MPNQDQSEDQLPEDLKVFLESLLADAGMSNLDPKMHEEMIKELYLRLDNFMITTIVEGLPAEKLEVFTKMAEEGKSRTELEAYLQANIENANDVFARAMLEFRNLYLGTTQTNGER